MDDSDLDERPDRIERRQMLILALLVVPYFVDIATLSNVWVTGVLVTAVGFVVFVMVVIVRRRNRSTTNG
ncbi:hypothetical protein [Haladaptatus sp. CMAA 1911]|uniref:hypothetical protein n=1 Tax=unclassified Haladaptatus TaxID=2622732 RepID=UPI003753F49B